MNAPPWGAEYRWIDRMLLPKEELVIERDEHITISLPNGTRLTIWAG